MDTPRWLDALRARIRALRSSRADADVDEEMAFHLAMQARENEARGMPPDDARRQARAALGGVAQTKERMREGRPLHGLETLAQDVRFALRLIRRAPGFAAVTILTLALGVGVNTAIFSTVYGILLRPLPYADADRLVRLYLVNPVQEITDGPLAVPELDDWRERARAFSSLAGYLAIPGTLTGQGDPVEVPAAFLVGDLFGTLGASARLGRLLTGEEMRRGVPNAVISERLWTRQFGADPGILGRSLVLNAQSYTVVGVIPENLRFPAAGTDVWAPHGVLSDESVGPRVRTQRSLSVVARLAPGVTVEQAQEDANDVAARLAAEFAATNRGWTAAQVVPLRTSIVGEIDTALLVVLAVVGCILLIACANLANLLLARGTARSHELATRAALGAGRLRIVRQLLTESLVLGSIGGLLGIALSIWGLHTLLALSAGTLPRVEDVRVDGRVVGYGLALTVFASLLVGILPAWRAGQTDPRPGGTRGSTGGGGPLRNALVIAEVTMAMVLVIGAGLMARSFLELRRVDPGFDPAQVLTVSLRFNLAGVSGNIGQHLVQRRAELVERIAALPGVVAAGSIRDLPLAGECSDRLEFVKPDGTAARDGDVLRATNCLVSAGYFEVMGIPLLRGEPLPESVPKGAPLPFLISEAAARRFWPGEDPIGQVVRANYGGRAIVVGIVGDVRQAGLGQNPPPLVYFHQRTAPRIAVSIVARTAGDPRTLMAAVRDLVRQVDPNQPIRGMATLDEVMHESIAHDRFFTLLFGLFGVLALALAGVGVYGVLAYSVGQRTREIGVRMALGADVGDVLRLVIGDGLRMVLVGVACGAAAALLTSRVLESQLFGISARDPLTFVVGPLVLVLVALIACYVPARRATRVEASTALR